MKQHREASTVRVEHNPDGSTSIHLPPLQLVAPPNEWITREQAGWPEGKAWAHQCNAWKREQAVRVVKTTAGWLVHRDDFNRWLDAEAKRQACPANANANANNPDVEQCCKALGIK